MDKLRYPISPYSLPRTPTPPASPPLSSYSSLSPSLSSSSPIPHASSPSQLTTSSLGLNSSHTSKLHDVHDRLTEFQNVIHSEVQQRKTREMQRVIQHDATAEQVMKLEKRLNFEIKQRQDTTKALQSIFETQLRQAAEWWEGAMKERSEQLLSGIELLSKRVSLLERDLDEEKKRRVKENTDSYEFVAAQLVSLKQQIDSDKIRKSDALDSSTSSLREEIANLQRQLSSEKTAREAALSNQREDILNRIEKCSTDDEKTETKLLAEIEKLKISLLEESEAREKQEEQIVHMLDRIVLDLQGGIHLASQ